MVFPVVLAVGALALYFLTKPKDKPKDKPKNDNIKLTGSEKVILKDWVYKNPNWKSIDDLPNDIFLPIVKKAGDNTDKRIDIQTQTIKFMKIVTPKKSESKENKKDSSNDDLEKKRKSDNDTFLQVYNNPKSVFKNSKGQKLTGKTLLSRWDKINRKSKQEQMKFRGLSLKEQITESKKDSVKLVKYLDEWKKQD